MKALRQLGKAKEHIKRGLFARAQHTGAHGESTSGRTPSESFHKATSRVPWGTLTATGFTFTGFGWALNSLSQSESFKNIDLSDLWKAPALANSLIGQPSWLSGWNVGAGMGPNSLADAAAKAMPAVVNIHHVHPSEEGRGEHRSCGSGFLVDSSGLVATNAHVVEAALEEQTGRKKDLKKPLRISLQDGRCFDGEVISIDRVSDLALLKIHAPGPLPTVKMGSSGGMRVGEWVLALGSPLTLQNSVTAGIVSCVGRQAKELGIASNTGFIQTDAEIGSSGGPLVNLAGEVVGISTMKALFSAGVSFAIPIDTAREILEQMQRQGRVVRPYIGIKLLELNEHNTSQMHQRYSRFPTRSSGLLVPHVLAGSPASKAGLKQGDIIIGFGNRNSKDVTVPALVEALTDHVGKNLQLHVLREDKELRLTVRAIEARNDYPEVQ